MTREALFSRGFWTIGIFGASYAVKLGSNVLLAHLLAPEVFGVMLVVNAIRLGLELFSDIGIEQNIVHSKDGLSEDFFNTAWTLQILRGAMLSAIFLSLAPWLSAFYQVDRSVLLAISFAPLLNGLSSTAIFALVKGLEVKRRNLFELRAELLSFAISISLVLVMPTVWALVWGALAGIATRSALSYMLPHARHRLMLDRRRVGEILGFGKWIMISSLLMYASTNLDRLYLGRIAPFVVLGVFSIAKTIADLPPALARRLSYQIVFPFLAHGDRGRSADTLADLGAARLRFVVVAAIGLGGLAGLSDIAIRLVYDSRYAAAGWMLFVLLMGAWCSVLSNLNEALVLGAGKPAYCSYSNIVRLLVLAAGLPLGYAQGGYAGVLLAIVASEFSQYCCIAVGQRQVGLTFGRQDVLASGLFLATIGLCIAARWPLGLGLPWQDWVASHG